MTSDTPLDPRDQDPPSRVFTETRPSTLVNATPETTATPAEIVEAPIEIEAPAEIADDPALALNFAPAPDAPFQSSVTVGVTCLNSGARVFYTTDGSEPNADSTLYRADKILLTANASLRARAFDGERRGPIAAAEYLVIKPLWEQKEPADQSDAVAHTAQQNLSAPDGWQVCAASVRGKLHAHRALWREDSFALGTVETAGGAWSICIVSDGAGSAPLSRVGSQVACQTAMGDLAGALGAIETLSDDINADLPRIKAALVGAANAALTALREQAQTRNQPLAAFAATLLILVRRAHQNSQLCAALQVGDGAIALSCASGLKMLGAADHGQHSSETRFLTTGGMEDDFANRVKFSLPADLNATLVVSDGVSDDYFPEDKRLIEVFDAVKPLAQNTEDAASALLEWLGYEKKGSSDDRTLVLSWPGQINADAKPMEAAQTGIDADEMGINESQTGIDADEMGINADETGINESQTGINESQTGIDADKLGIDADELGIDEAPLSAEATANAPLLDEFAAELAQSNGESARAGDVSDGG